jgi:flagellar motor switch protein FliM
MKPLAHQSFAGPSAGHDAGVKPLDLTGRERQLRSAMQVMARIAARFSRAARRTLPFMVRRRTRLRPEPVAIAEPAGDSGTDGPTFVVALEADGGSAWGAVLLNADALMLVLEGSLGATESAGVRLGSELTLAQRALAGRLARSLGSDFAKSVQEEVGFGMKLTTAQSLTAGEPAVLPGSDGLRVDCIFEGIEGAPTVSIAMSAEALQAAAKEMQEEEPMHGDPRMVEALQDVPIEVVAELGRVKLGLREVLNLRVGQVIRLDTATDDPVTVRVAGLTKLFGVPVISRGQLSIDIRGRNGG